MNQSNIFAKLKRMPLSLLVTISVICCFGFLILYSAAEDSLYPWTYKQLAIFILCIPLIIIISVMDLKIIFRFAYPFYLLTIMMLLYTDFFGTTVMGAKRWIDLGFTRIQPSELTKLAIVVMLAKYFYQIRSTHLNDVPRLLLAILAVIIPDILVIKQPDLGTGIVILIIATVMFFAAGVDIKKFIVVGIGILISLPLLWSLLHDYQRKRMLMFLNPDDDPLGSGYNIIQSKIAIGSGGALGKGLSHGTQSHLRFLPEYQTDFIFATFAEEFGFVGCITLICLYALIIMYCLSIAANAKNQFSKLLVIGITTAFFCHVFINIAMVMGIMPVVGVPLPLLSYGGTMLFSMLIGFALIANVHIHKYANL